MKSVKEYLLQNTPEFFFISFGIWWQLDSGVTINPFAIGLILVMSAQIIFKSRIAAGVSGAILFLGSLYFILALLSDYHSFSPDESSAALNFLVIGGLLIASSLSMSFLLMLKASHDDYRLLSSNLVKGHFNDDV